MGGKPTILGNPHILDLFGLKSQMLHETIEDLPTLMYHNFKPLNVGTYSSPVEYVGILEKSVQTFSPHVAIE